MPEHKMVVIDGIRYRPEDAPRRPAPAPAPTQDPVVTTPTPGSAVTVQAEAFDPAGHTVDEVLAHLGEADDAERERVLAAEKDGKARKGVLEAPAAAPSAGGDGGPSA